MNYDEGLMSERAQADRARVLARYAEAREKEFGTLANSGSPLAMNCLSTYYSNDRQFSMEVQNEFGNLVCWVNGVRTLIPKGAEYYDHLFNRFIRADHVSRKLQVWAGSGWSNCCKLSSVQDRKLAVKLPAPAAKPQARHSGYTTFALGKLLQESDIPGVHAVQAEEATRAFFNPPEMPAAKPSAGLLTLWNPDARRPL